MRNSSEGMDNFLDLRRRLYRMLDIGMAESAPPGPSFTPPLDITATPDGLTITVELPGMAREDIEVELQGNLLTIAGERVPASRRRCASARDASDADTRYYRRERPCGRFRRTLALPTSNHIELSAALKDGVLTVKVRRAKTTAVKVGEG